MVLRNLPWRPLATLCACVLGITLAACPGVLHPMEKPQVTVLGVTAGEITLDGIEGRIDLDVFNPNDVAVPLRQVSWRLSVGDTPAVEGRIELSASIPARQAAPVSAVVRIAPADALRVSQVLGRGETAYRLDAQLTFATRLGNITVHTSHTGDLARM